MTLGLRALVRGLRHGLGIVFKSRMELTWQRIQSSIKP
jgi:hypothetical protein